MKEFKLRGKGKGSFASKVIRALGKESGFRNPLPSRDRKPVGVSAYYVPYDVQRELRNALLEVEKLKAKHMAETQIHHSCR